MSPRTTPSDRSKNRAGIGTSLSGKALIWKAKIRTAVILALVGMSAYLVSVLMALPINVALAKILSDPRSMSTLTKVLTAALALDLSKFLVLALLAFPLGRLLASKPWVVALGAVLSCYAFDAGLAYVLQDFRVTWANWYALSGRIPLALLTWLVAFVIIRRAAKPLHKKLPDDTKTAQQGPDEQPDESVAPRSPKNPEQSEGRNEHDEK